MGPIVGVCWFGWLQIVLQNLLQVVHKIWIEHSYHYGVDFVFFMPDIPL
jgi:hypothetical protein